MSHSTWHDARHVKITGHLFTTANGKFTIDNTPNCIAYADVYGEKIDGDTTLLQIRFQTNNSEIKDSTFEYDATSKIAKGCLYLPESMSCTIMTMLINSDTGMIIGGNGAANGLHHALLKHDGISSHE